MRNYTWQQVIVIAIIVIAGLIVLSILIDALV